MVIIPNCYAKPNFPSPAYDPVTTKVTRIYHHGDLDSGLRHRRQHGDLQSDPWRPVGAITLSAGRSVGQDLSADPRGSADEHGL